MSKFKGWEEELEYYDEFFLAKGEGFEKIYSDNELLFEFMEATKNKKVFIMCMELLPIPFILEKLKDPKTSQEMVFKLTLHSNSFVQSAILKREDVTAAMLKQMIENSKDELITESRWHIINHKKMDETTLFDLTDFDNNQILCAVLLTNKTSRRIIKKLQNSSDPEVQTIAMVRDPETDAYYIEKVIKREIRKANKTKYDYIDSRIQYEDAYEINDILEGTLRNPKLPKESVELFKRFTKTAVLTLVIPHPNVSDDLLDYYYKKGDDDVKKAVLARRKKEEQMH